MRPIAQPARPQTRRGLGPGPAVLPDGAADDRGSATLELTVLFPMLLLLIFGVVQGALYFHARNVALAAAEQGVRAGRADGQADPAGTAAREARAFLADTGELANLTALNIVPAVSGTQLRVTITADTISLLPGVPGPQIRQSAAGSLERFTNGSTG